jgi:hypothetical protein
MADSHASHVQTTGPLTVDAFIADRQQIWASFTSMVRLGAIGVAIILILMAIFLV